MMQDAILQATVKYILGNRKNAELAHQVEKAMPDVRKELCRRVLETAKERLEMRINELPNGWVIWSSCQDGGKDLMQPHSYLALRRQDWARESQDQNYDSGAQLHAEGWDWRRVWLGVYYHQVGHPDATHNVWERFSFFDWRQPEFMMSAIDDQNEIAGRVADELIRWAQWVENSPNDGMNHHDEC